MMRLKIKHTAWAALSAAIVIVGCKVGPNYQGPPPLRMPEKYIEASTHPTSRAATLPVANLSNWWESFDDPQLNDLIDRAVQSNYTLREAVLRVAQGRAQRDVAAADWWPMVNANGSYTRERRASNGFSNINNNSAVNNNTSGNTNTGGNTNSGGSTNSGGTSNSGTGSGSGTGASSGGTTGSGTNGTNTNSNSGVSRLSSLWQAGFDATWELDVFGGTARSVEAANANIQAAVEDQRDTLVTLLSEVARDYIDLRGFQHDLAITENNLKSQQETLDLTRKRFNAGISSDLDVAQAEAEVETTQASIPSLQTTVRQDIYAISVLCGQTPEELSAELSVEKPMPNKWPMVPLGLPSDIVRHRPDVRRAERQLAAATANVGVATADLFPKFSLTGSYGWDATKFAGLFSDPANTWAVGPNVTWPIFSAGQIQANIRVQNALQAQAVATYSEAVLTALQDVENSLVAYHREQDRRIALAQAVASDQRAFDLSTQLYQRGLVDFLSVLDSERALYTAQDLLVRSDIAVSEDLIALYKSLGGGWE